jgi:hypothetical protein
MRGSHNDTIAQYTYNELVILVVRQVKEGVLTDNLVARAVALVLGRLIELGIRTGWHPSAAHTSQGDSTRVTDDLNTAMAENNDEHERQLVALAAATSSM